MWANCIANRGPEREKNKNKTNNRNSGALHFDKILSPGEGAVSQRTGHRGVSAGNVAPKAVSVPAGCSQWKMLEAAAAAAS